MYFRNHLKSIENGTFANNNRNSSNPFVQYNKDEPKFPILNCSLKNVLRNKPYIATVMLITIYRYFFNKKLLETLLIFNIHLE